MDQVREVVSVAHGLRKARQIRVRQPLALLKVAVLDVAALEPYRELIAAELNVKAVALVAVDAFTAEHDVERRLSVNARAAGPRIGKSVQQAIAGAKSGDWSEVGGVVTAGGIALEEGEYELTTVIGGGEDDAAAAVLPSGGFVLLDTSLTPELEAEGYARDVIRAVQDERKRVGLHVADRIHLTLTVPADRVAAVETHRELIAGETLAQDPATGAAQVTVAAGGELGIQVAKA